MSSARDHYKGIYSVTRMIEDHIALLTNATGYTIRRYKSNHKCHVADTLGTLDATKVEYRDIVQWMKGIEAKGLASKTIANVHGLISAAFNSMVRDKRRPDNPCKGIALPKSQDTEEKATFLTQEEWRLVKAELTDPYRALFDFLILTGLRFSEATALKGRHFQEARSGQHIVKVTQAWTRDEDNHSYVGPPKTPQSRRSIALPSKTYSKFRPFFMPAQTTGSFVFLNTTNTPIDHQAIGQGNLWSLGAGVKTVRDAWVFGSSRNQLQDQVTATANFFNAEISRYSQHGKVTDLADFVDADPVKISWSTKLRDRLAKKQPLATDSKRIRTALYRPFFKQHLYFDHALNEARSLLPKFFPTVEDENVGFYIVGSSNDKPFSALATDSIPDLSLWGSGQGQFIPRYTFAEDIAGGLFDEIGTSSRRLRREDNITDAALADYRSTYGPEITKDDIFHYVYGILHSPEYRTRFAADLKKMLARIPQVPGADRFQAFVEAGRALSDLHIGYEELEPHPLNEVVTGLAVEQDDYARYAVTKMKYAGKAGAWDKTRIIYNAHITLKGIPEDVQRYMLGFRSAVDWIIERYQVQTDKPSGIVNDPNDWSREHKQPRYIIDLIGRIVALSLETNRIVDSLPGLD